jgi:hypothetical protein
MTKKIQHSIKNYYPCKNKAGNFDPKPEEKLTSKIRPRNDSDSGINRQEL